MLWLCIGTAVLVLLFGVVAFRGAPYVPSRKRYLKEAFIKLYPLGPSDTLVDLGSGGGVVLREASNMGARSVGYEINPILVLVSRFLSRKQKRVSVRLTDMWLAKFPSDVTVVYIFGVERDMQKVVNLVQKEATRLQRILYLISYGNEVKGIFASKHVGAYHLYVFNPLQPLKAQV